MSECSVNLYNDGRTAGFPCSRCGEGPCHVWRDQYPCAGENPETFSKPEEPAPAPTETRPDPAYAAALSETSILVDARARAFDLAMKLAAQSEDADQINFPRLLNISNRILKYLLEGK